MFLSNPLKLDRSSTPFDLSRITEGIYKGHSWVWTHFSQSFSIYLASSPPKTSLSHLKPLPQDFFELNQVFPHLLSLQSLFFMHFMLFNLSFWVFQKFWDFQNQRDFCEIFGMGFEDLILKTSFISSHEHYKNIFMHLNVCNWLCAGKFGLGWARDAISFACHMFMHSHAYVLSIQYIFDIFELLGTFLIVFSLSLSLSLSPFTLVCFYGTQT